MTDAHLINEFIAECRDHFNSLEPDLLALEKDGAAVDPEVVNRVFRAMHSMKGSSGFFGLDPINKLTHSMENVMNLIREKSIIPSSDLVDALFSGLDKLIQMVDNVSDINGISYQDEINRIQTILQQNNVAVSAPAPLVENEDETQAPIERVPDIEPDVIPEPVAPSSSDDVHTKWISENVHLFEVFIAEFQDAVLQIEKLLLKIEHVTSSALEKGLKNIYSKLVTLRQSVSFFRMSHIENYIHLLETVLQQLISKELPFEKTTFDALLSGLDVLHQVSGAVEEIIELDFQKERAVFNRILKGDADIPEKNIQDILQKPEKIVKKVVVKETPTPELKVEQRSSVEPVMPVQEASNKQVKDVVVHETVRVNMSVIDRLMTLAGELVLVRNRMRQLIESHVETQPELGTAFQNLDYITTEIQENTMQTRMQPVGNVLNKFPRLVRDLSRKLNKKVDIDIDDGNVELDKSIVEGLSDPLTHIIRNCVDHGIEMPDVRLLNGKSEVGHIALFVYHEGGQVSIEIKDDGKGINVQKVVEKAIKNDVITKEVAAKMTDKDKLDLIFAPGLSTAEKLTDISGRGVGMDVVKTNMQKLGGHLELDTAEGQGTTVFIRVPLTLAIIPCLIVGVDTYRFAIPQNNLRELVRILPEEVDTRIERVGGIDMLFLRDELLPLVDLAGTLNLENSKLSSKDLKIVCVQVGSNRYGLIVEDFYDNEEIVVKPLSTHLKNCLCFSGATIMGDSRVALILDVAGIAISQQLRFGEISEEVKKHIQSEIEDNNTVINKKESVVIFNNDLDEFFAVRLSELIRLEKVNLKDVEHVGDREFISYCGEGLPLIKLSSILPVRPFPADQASFYVIIPKLNSFKPEFGIAVSNIIDIEDIAIHLEGDSTTTKGVLCSHIINEKLTLFLNLKEIEALYFDGIKK